MKSICYSGVMIGAIFLSVIFFPTIIVRAASVIITDAEFSAIPAEISPDYFSSKLTEINSPLVSYSESVGDQIFTASDSIWVASQQQDFTINPAVLFTTLLVQGKLNEYPMDGKFTLQAQKLSFELWAYYNQFYLGDLSITLADGSKISSPTGINAASYAVMKHLALAATTEADLLKKADLWQQEYLRIFSGLFADSLSTQAVPNIEPFMRLPFTQPGDNFIKINSFFDHAQPGVFDDSLLRFDGNSLGSSSFNNCTLGVNCYGGHNGLDYSTGAGLPIYAVAAGIVSYRYYNTDSSQGTVDSGLIINHGNGYLTNYWHMDPISVAYGQTVQKGQLVGYSGNIGQSSGAHLHFALKIASGNKAVDPYGWWSSTSDPWGESQWMWEGDLIADNKESQAQLFYRSYWNRDTNGYQGESYWTNSVVSSSSNWAVWGAYLSSPSAYDVLAYFPKNSLNTTAARYTIFHANGSNVVQVNQATDGDRFVLLGTYNFNEGPAAVLLSDLTGESNKRVYFDAIKWAPHSLYTPTNINLSNNSINENLAQGATVGTLSTVDADAYDTFSYSLVSGAGSDDNASFSISSNILKTTAVFDYESKNSYTIRIRTTDSGNRTYEKAFQIAVSNLADAPSDIQFSAITISENLPANSPTGTLSTTDQDSAGHTYSLVSGSGSTDNALFTISGISVLTKTPLDYETKATFSIRVRSTDPTNLYVEKIFSITITNINDAPTNITLSPSSILENKPINTFVGTLTASDQDSGDSHSFGLVSSEQYPDNARFLITGNQLLSNSIFDLETKGQYSIRVRASDVQGLTVDRTLTITINNISEFSPHDISLSNSAIPENEAAGFEVGILTGVDQDTNETFTFSLVSGTGSEQNSWFTISSNKLLTTLSLDYESGATASIRVKVSDSGGASFEKIFLITITFNNDAPTNIILSANLILENAPIGTKIGSFSTVDQDSADTHTYSLIEGNGSVDNSQFIIEQNNLLSNSVFDYETRQTYSIRLRSRDTAGAYIDLVFSIKILNQDEYAPHDILLNPTTLLENKPLGTLAGTLTSQDLDLNDTFTYTLVSGTGDGDNPKFRILSSQIQTNSLLDYEAQTQYSVRIRSTSSGGLWMEKSFLIQVNNVNEFAPTDIVLDRASFSENLPAGSLVGLVSSIDADGIDQHTYRLVSGQGSNGNTFFNISGNQVISKISFDYETQNSYQIRIRSTDSGGLYVEKNLQISISDTNDPPTDLLFSNTSIDENSPISTTVATLTTIDQDISDHYIYELIPGEGSDNNGDFSILADTLTTQTVFDYEQLETLFIRIRVTDSGGLSFEKAVQILINGVNEFPPTAINLLSSGIRENLLPGATGGYISVVDQDRGDSHTFSLVTGDGDRDNRVFSIADNRLLGLVIFDYEGQNLYSIRVRVTDSGGLFYEQPLFISIIDMYELYFPSLVK